jgi:hypothetical protein
MQHHVGELASAAQHVHTEVHAGIGATAMPCRVVRTAVVHPAYRASCVRTAMARPAAAPTTVPLMRMY